MEYTSIEELLSTPAEDYFSKYITASYQKGKTLNWLYLAGDDIIENSRHGHTEIKYETVLIKDVIVYPTRIMLRYWRNVGKLTIDAMNKALAINGLSLDMHPYQVAALLSNNDINSEIDIFEKFAISLKTFSRKQEDGGLSISFGKGIIPGYECTLNIKKV